MTGLLIGIFLGLVLGYVIRDLQQSKSEFQLRLMIQLDATQEIAIKAIGKDSEGNEFELTGDELTLTVENASEDFGTINDTNDTFNPGAAGGTGTIVGKVTKDGKEYTASLEVELVHGGLSEIALNFAPATEAGGGDQGGVTE